MITWEEIAHIINQKNFPSENAKIEYKASASELPKDFWKTYSAFANSSGGVVLLGVCEEKSQTFSISGVQDIAKIRNDLFSNLRNPEKVSSNLLSDDSVRDFEIDGKTIIAIKIPSATADKRPIFINGDLRNAYVRLNSGDHKMTQEELVSFLSSYRNKGKDVEVLPFSQIEDLHLPTVHKYRNQLKSHNPNSPLNSLSDELFLERIRACKKDSQTEKIGLTYAGLLMFGKNHVIGSNVNDFFFEYYEEHPDYKRYRLRITDLDLEEGNLFEFYLKIAPILSELGKDTHFKLDGLTRTEENSITRALREALVNAIAHADYWNNPYHLKIVRSENQLMLENGGLMLVSPEDAIKGERSECRNEIIHTLFRLIGAGERQGKGVQDLFESWQERYFSQPELKSENNHTTLILKFQAGQITELEEQMIALFGEAFKNLKPIQRDCLIFVGLYENGVYFDEMKAKLTHFSRHEISEVLKFLKKKDFISSTGTRRKQLYKIKLDHDNRNTDFSSIDSVQASEVDKVNNNQADNLIGTGLRGLITDQVTDQVTDQAEDAIKRLLAILQTGEKSAKTLMALLNISHRPHFRDYYLNPALQAGLIEMTLPEKPNSPKQAYRLAKKEQR